MSRLRSQSDMEYYPTYIPTVQRIASLFNYKRMPSLVRMIDTCAGEGDALSALEDSIRYEFQERRGEKMPEDDVETYGIELDTERAVAARKKLRKVVQTDYFNMLVTDKQFNVNFLNPPYDYDPQYKRLEHRFLVHTTRLLGRGGILIFLVPRYVLGTCAEYLSQNYNSFRIWQEEGNPDAERFNQIILMAERDFNPSNALRTKKAIKDFAEGKLDFVGNKNHRYIIPVVDGEVDRFTALRMDYGDVLAEIERSGIETKQEWQDMHLPPKNVIKEPLMPPRVGHMGLIMAGGGVGGLGIPLANGDDSIIFRAASKKVTQTESQNEEGTIQRISERMSSTAVVLDPRNWQFMDDVQLGPFVGKWSQELASYIADVMPPKYTPEGLRELLGHAPEYHKLLRKPMPGNGQRLSIEGAMFSLLSGEKGTTIVGEMGTGKTYLSESAAHLAGYRRMLILGPPTLVWKWEDEILKTIPNARVYVLGKRPVGRKAKEPFYRMSKNPMKQLRWLDEKYTGKNPDVPVYIVLAHSVAKASYGRIPAIQWRWGYRTQPEYAEVSGELIEPRWTPFATEVEVDIDPEDLPPGVDPTKEHTKVVKRYVQRMCCPECGQPVMMRKDEYADWNWLSRGRRVCMNPITVGRLEIKDELGRSAYGTESRPCGARLWQALARNFISETPGTSWHGEEQLKERMLRRFIYGISVDADEAREYGGRGSKSADYEPKTWATVHAQRREVFKSNIYPPRRFDLAEYYKRFTPNLCQLMVADEFHQFKSGDSAQGQTARIFAEIIPQSITLTGTLMAGYARDLFYLLYGFGDREIRDDFEHKDRTRWRNQFGFVERTVYLESQNAKRSRTKKQDERPKDLPGAMPAVLRYILGHSVFIRLLDVAAGLPDFSEHAVTVELDEEVDPLTGHTQKDNYKVMEKRVLQAIKDLTFTNPRAAAKLVSIFAQAVLTYPDACTQDDACLVYHPVDGHPIINRPALPADKLYPKEKKLLEIVQAEKAAGRKVLVFATHTNRRDLLPRLSEIMDMNDVKATVLRSDTVDADKRMPWLEKRIKEGLDVLICHPQLVETGVDMLDFATIIWYEADYNTARVRQASRRSWRIGQTQPVRIYYLTYADTKQTQAIYLIAQKVATSLAVEGDLSSDGLTSLAGNDNMGRSIAQMLVDSDIDFDGSFESGISIASLASDSEGEELLGDTDYDLEDMDPELPDGLDIDTAVSLVTQTLVAADPDVASPVEADTKDGFDMPLFGTLEPEAKALEVCDGCEQFILTDEERITTPAMEIIEGRNGNISGSIVPSRVFHTGCYGPWSERMQAKADGNEPVDVAPPVNAPKAAPEPAANVPDPTSFGAVSMGDWMSAFGLEVEDLERGKRKRTRKSRQKVAEQATLIPLR